MLEELFRMLPRHAVFWPLSVYVDTASRFIMPRLFFFRVYHPFPLSRVTQFMSEPLQGQACIQLRKCSKYLTRNCTRPRHLMASKCTQMKAKLRYCSCRNTVRFGIKIEPKITLDSRTYVKWDFGYENSNI